MMMSPYVRIRQLEHPFEVSMLLPGSKSITLRDLILASLANGESIIRYPGICDDTTRMEASLKKMGIPIHRPTLDLLKIDGKNGQFLKNEIDLDVGESGTSARLLLALSCLRQGQTRIDAQASMRARPNRDLLEALSHLGAEIESTNHSYLPVSIKGPEKYSKVIKIKGDQSSQYITGLLIIAPLLPKGLELIVEGELVSKPYIDITIHEMKKFGVHVENDRYKKFRVTPQVYKPAQVTIEGDASAASYFSALATLHGGTVVFKNLDPSTQQGDFAFFDICKKLGAQVKAGEHGVRITGPKKGELRPLQGSIDMEKMPDVAPTLMAMAPFIPGRTRITGLSTLRIKECDRISAPVKELRKFGLEIIEGHDYVEIEHLQASPHRHHDIIEVDTYQDHRMAMSLAVFATKRGHVKILNPSCVQKTYPHFWTDLLKTGSIDA